MTVSSLRVTTAGVMCLFMAVGCVQLTRIDLANEADGNRASATEIAAAREIIERIATDFGFERHPLEETYLEWHRTREWAQNEVVAAYSNTGSKGFGKINLLLAIDRGDGHLVVEIDDRDAYGWPEPFVDSIQDAVVSALAERFPGRHIRVDRTR